MRRPSAAVGLGFALVAVVAVLDVLTVGTSFTAITMLGPFVASVAAGPGKTLAVGVAAVVVSMLLGLVDADLDRWDHWLRVATVVAAVAVSWLVATTRFHRDAAMARLARVADIAQRAILRPPPPVLGDVRIAARYLVAVEDRAVGGDLFETAFSPWGVRVVVGDARGKGLEAVELAAAVLAAFRENLWQEDLTSLASALDAAVVARAGEEDFVTAVLVELPPASGVRVVNLGHLPPLRLRGEALVALEGEQPSLPLGLGPTPKVEEFDMEPGDRILLYTDGLSEARDAQGRDFPFTEALSVDDDLQAVVDGLLTRLGAHVGGGTNDDVAVVLVARDGHDGDVVPSPGVSGR